MKKYSPKESLYRKTFNYVKKGFSNAIFTVGVCATLLGVGIYNVFASPMKKQQRTPTPMENLENRCDGRIFQVGTYSGEQRGDASELHYAQMSKIGDNSYRFVIRDGPTEKDNKVLMGWGSVEKGKFTPNKIVVYDSRHSIGSLENINRILNLR